MSEIVRINRNVTRVNGRLAYHDVVLPDGPWHSEPDRVEFESDGFSCLLLRNSSWCGYVAVPPGHPWHGKNYDEVRIADDGWPDVHGGLTYSHKCNGAICHIPKPGESDDVWWVGFDCAHSGDLCLYTIARGWDRNHETYRDVEYARRETRKLAAQARSVQP